MCSTIKNSSLLVCLFLIGWFGRSLQQDDDDQTDLDQWAPTTMIPDGLVFSTSVQMYNECIT